MKTKVSDVVARFLAARNMRHVFGIIGAGNAHIFDSVTRSGTTEIVCVHHEQAACMAIQTYYRTCGVVTAALLTTGGGSTNGVTGVVSAWMDSIPCLILSGNENSRFTREDNPLRIYGIQGYDSPAMVRKVTRYAARVMDPRRVRYELEKAYFLATTGRPGPCWLDIPMDIQAAQVEAEDLVDFDPALDPDTAPLLESQDVPTSLSADLDNVLGLLASAKRPLLWLGHGIRLAGAQSLLPEFLDRVRVPALVSWTGIDLIDSDHPRVYGRAGTYGQRCANFVLQNCDALVTIGTRLAMPQVGYDITELARAARIAVVDIDPLELDKYRNRFEYRICADARIFLTALLQRCQRQSYEAPAAWISQCDAWREQYPWVGPEHADRDGFINSYPFMEKLIPFLKPDQIVVTDMGTALLSGHQVLRIKPPQRLMTSLGLGEMGYGLPGAMGASFARNRGEVLCLNCDGGMMMNLQELQTVVHHQLPIKLVIFNNDGYLMIKHTQKALFKGHYSGTDRKSGVSCPDFSALAQAFGMPSFRIRTWADFDKVIPELQALTGPAICEVFTHPEQPLLPKLSLAARADGTLVSPPLEDLSPLLARAEMQRNMVVGMHPKSLNLTPSDQPPPKREVA